MLLLIAIIYTMLCLATAYLASKRGRNFWAMLFISICISPVFIIGMMCEPRKSSLFK